VNDPSFDPFFQIFYVNTQTGQVSRDLPTETGVDVSGSDLAGFTASQASTRGGASGRQGIGVSYPVDAGFGLSKHTETLEPWVRKLADDGMSYYFTNKQTGEIRWTVPESEIQSTRTGRTRAPTKSSTTSSHNDDTLASPNRLRSDSLVSMPYQGSESSADRTSLDSDDSETFYMDRDRNGSVPTPLQASNEERNVIHCDRSFSPEVMVEEKVAVELTSAERSAKLLQAALSPPGPESLAVSSAAARQAIMAVIESIQMNDITRLLEEDTTLDNLVYTVVLSIRNLLYVSAAPSGHIPINVIPHARDTRDRRDTTASQAMLKPAQRKVTATLSKLVLSARAIQYNSGSSIVDTPIRIEGDAEELDRAVDGFVVEVQRLQNQQVHSGVGLKRLRGVFSTAHIGLGLVGAGAAGSWKGLGWVSLEETDETPGRILGTEVVTELRAYILQVQESFHSFRSNIGRLMSDSGKSYPACRYCLCTDSSTPTSAERLILESRKLILQLSMVLEFVGNIHIARHVDIDGIRREPGDAPGSDLYTETVENARLLIRTLEFATQSLYDDGSSFLTTAQAIRHQESSRAPQRNSNFFGHMGGFGAALEANLGIVLQTIEALLSIGHDQADMAQGDYNGSIEWRMSRLSIIDTQFGGAHRPLSTLNSYDEDVVDMELAFQKPEMKGQARADSPNAYESGPLVSEATVDTAPISDVSNRAASGGTTNTFVPPPAVLPADLGDSPLFEEDCECTD
jgi:son of sevenless-like protein